jgi:hypothetical protein
MPRRFGQQAPGDARRMEQRRPGSQATPRSQVIHAPAGALAAANQNVPVVELESLNFRRAPVRLKLAPDATTLEQFSRRCRRADTPRRSLQAPVLPLTKAIEARSQSSDAQIWTLV